MQKLLSVSGQHVLYILSIVSVLALFVLHLGIINRLWAEFYQFVDRDMCQNTCWDRVFKMGYESGPSSYKHVFFNITWNTFGIFVISVIFIEVLLKVIYRTYILLFLGNARPRMCLLLLSALYPHYYAWWNFFNYLNDDFYSQFCHQLFFTMTEVVSTAIVIHLVDTTNEITPRKILVIISVAILHVLASGSDQFVANILLGKGKLHQVLRDLGFMLPDLLHIIIPLLEVHELSRINQIPPRHLFKLKELAFAVGTISVLWLICGVLL